MDDFIAWLSQYWPSLAGSFTAVVSAVSTWLVFRVKLRHEKEKNAVLTQQLREAVRRDTFTVCPGCGRKMALSDIDWYLPGMIPDNNLNGRDDRLEDK